VASCLLWLFKVGGKKKISKQVKANLSSFKNPSILLSIKNKKNTGNFMILTLFDTFAAKIDSFGWIYSC